MLYWILHHHNRLHSTLPAISAGLFLVKDYESHIKLTKWFFSSGKHWVYNLDNGNKFECFFYSTTSARRRGWASGAKLLVIKINFYICMYDKNIDIYRLMMARKRLVKINLIPHIWKNTPVTSHGYWCLTSRKYIVAKLKTG